MFSFPLIRDPLFTFYGSSEEDDSLKKSVITKLGKNDVAGAQHAARQIFSIYDRSEIFKKIFNHCFDKGDFVKAKEAALEIPSEAALNKVFGIELEKNQFTGAIETCGMIPSKSAVKKLADKIKEANPDPETMKQIEDAVSKKIYFLPSFQKMILEVLMTLFAALGNQVEVDRLEKKIGELEGRIEPDISEAIRKPLALCLGASVGSYALIASKGSIPLACGVAALTALGVLNPSARRPENLLGISAGIVASAAGLPALPALAVGLSTGIVSRIPLVQRAPIAVLNTGASLVQTGMNMILWTGRTMLHLMDKTVDNVIAPVVEGTARSTVSAASAILDGAGSLMNAVDSALDTVTFRK